MRNQLFHLSDPLFTVEMAHADPTKVFGSKDDFTWEFAIEFHLGQYCVDDRFVKVMELAKTARPSRVFKVQGTSTTWGSIGSWGCQTSLNTLQLDTSTCPKSQGR